MKAPRVVHPLLFAIYPVVFLYAHNIAQVPVRAVVLPTVISVLVTLLLWVPLRLALKSWARAAVMLSFVLIAFFSYSHVYNAIEPLRIEVASFVLGPNKVLLGASLLALLSLLVACVRTRSNLYALTRVLNVVGLALILLPAGTIAAHTLSTSLRPTHNRAPKDHQQQATRRAPKDAMPNIYYIIVDAYTRSDVFKALYHHDNSAFLAYLRERDFYVADKSRSNYCQTFLSLASSMNLRYFDDIEKIVNLEWKHRQPVIDILHDNVLFEFLKRRGYTIAAFSSGFYATEFTGRDRYLTPTWTLDEFQNELLTSTPIGLLLGEFGIVDQHEVHTARVHYIFDHLSTACTPGAPTFVFAHIASPHPPFVFGPNGESRNQDIPFTYADGDHLVNQDGITREDYARQYVDQVAFINRRLRAAVDDILRTADRPTVIIIQADHGPRSTLKWEHVQDSCVTECMSILNAYYVMGEKPVGLHDRISPVNSFRMLLNHVFGTNYKLLPDRSYYSSARYPYKFTDMTERMDQEERAGLSVPDRTPSAQARSTR